jgi:16S rRNA (guanine527-N7)-methyltransferase
MNSQLLDEYFPGFNQEKKSQLSKLEELTREWNEKINVVSRKDIDHLFIHHILHSLALYKFVRLKPGMTVLDVGTGGGFPGIPLAIAFPETKFKLIDGRSKKTLVAANIAEALKLNNVVVRNIRSEELKESFDVILGRAVTNLPEFISIVDKNLRKSKYPESGIYYWSGGNIPDRYYKIFRIDQVYNEEYFKGKFILLYKKVPKVLKVIKPLDFITLGTPNFSSL